MPEVHIPYIGNALVVKSIMDIVGRDDNQTVITLARPGPTHFFGWSDIYEILLRISVLVRLDKCKDERTIPWGDSWVRLA